MSMKFFFRADLNSNAKISEKDKLATIFKQCITKLHESEAMELADLAREYFMSLVPQKERSETTIGDVIQIANQL